MQVPGYESISPQDLKRRINGGDSPVLLDVREPWEFQASRIEGSKLIPMGELYGRVSELDPSSETVVICHHGSRSAYVTQALGSAGFQNVLNLEGGLDAYSREDSSVPRY